MRRQTKCSVAAHGKPKQIYDDGGKLPSAGTSICERVVYAVVVMGVTEPLDGLFAVEEDADFYCNKFQRYWNSLTVVVVKRVRKLFFVMETKNSIIESSTLYLCVTAKIARGTFS